MKQGRQAHWMGAWTVLFAFISVASLHAQGTGLLNQVDIIDSAAIEGIDEILAFRAFEPDPANGTIRLVFEFADIDYETGISPTVMFIRNGARIAHLRPDVVFDDTGAMRKFHYNMIEISVAPQLVPESALLIQFFPNTDKLVTYKVSFLAATVLRMNENTVTQTPIAELLKSITNEASGTEQDEALNP